MKVVGTAERIELEDPIVAVAGDWDSAKFWVKNVFGALHGRGLKTLIQLGDCNLGFGNIEASIDERAAAAGIDRVLVVLGNHDHYGKLTPLFEAHPGQALRLNHRVWALPRPFMLTIAGRSVLTLGGAASVNFHDLVPGTDWWSDEAVTTQLRDAAIALGHADVMLAHDGPEESPIHSVSHVLRHNPQRWPADALAYSRVNRRHLTEAFDASGAGLLMHGHMHIHGAVVMADGRRVVSLPANGQQGNLTELNLITLEVDDVRVPGI